MIERKSLDALVADIASRGWTFDLKAGGIAESGKPEKRLSARWYEARVMAPDNQAIIRTKPTPLAALQDATRAMTKLFADFSRSQ